MEVFLIFPKSKQAQQELGQELAKFQSEQALKSIQKLPCSTEQKLELVDAALKHLKGHVFASEIPRSINAAEISVENKSIYDHDRSGKAALAYENLTREVLSLGKQIKRHRTDPVR